MPEEQTPKHTDTRIVLKDGTDTYYIMKVIQDGFDVLSFEELL